MTKKTYHFEFDEQETCDILTGLEKLKETAKNESAAQRFQKLWNKITDIFEERT